MPAGNMSVAAYVQKLAILAFDPSLLNVVDAAILH